MFKHPNKQIFFRNDDVYACDDSFKKFVGLFLWHRVPVHLTVIPNELTSKCRVFLKQCLKKYPQLIEIGQHGYKHLNYSSNMKKKYEFGIKRSYVQQRKDIADGKKILEGITKEKLIFTPPWHGFDGNTLKIIYELGFSGISLDKKSKSLSKNSPIQNFLTNVYFNKKNLKGWYVEKINVLLGEINAVKGAAVGILIHHNKFNSDRELQELSDLLLRLRKLKGVEFRRLSDCGIFQYINCESHGSTISRV